MKGSSPDDVRPKPDPRRAASTRLLLVGAGHAHLDALSRTRELTESGFDVTLLSPSPNLFYSGMATGVLSGRHRPEDALVDASKLVRSGGGSWLEGRADSVNPSDRTVLLTSGETVGYDLVSFATGSVSRVPETLEDAEDIIPVKPVENLTALRKRLLNVSGNTFILGGGAAGCEVAANAAAVAGGGRITVTESSERLLPGAPERASVLMRSVLEERGVSVRVGETAEVAGDADSGYRVAFRDGTEDRFGTVVSAAGVEAGEVFRESGLATGGRGGLLTDEFLRSVASPTVFGGGDAVSFSRPEGLPGFGVFAVRQGPVLTENLLATLGGRSLTPFEPQRRNLYIMDLADGTGLAVYGRFAWRGRAALVLKDRIDRSFVRKYGAGT